MGNCIKTKSSKNVLSMEFLTMFFVQAPPTKTTHGVRGFFRPIFCSGTILWNPKIQKRPFMFSKKCKRATWQEPDKVHVPSSAHNIALREIWWVKPLWQSLSSNSMDTKARLSNITALAVISVHWKFTIHPSCAPMSECRRDVFWVDRCYLTRVRSKYRMSYF